MEATVHLGIQRMEQATWRAPQLHVAPLPRPARRALIGRAVAAAAAFAILGVVGVAARPGVVAHPKVRIIIADARDATTGQPVSRSEWVGRAEGQLAAS